MNSKERVYCSIGHQEPDRVPLALWGGSYGLVDDLYLNMLDLLELDNPVAPFRKGHTINYLDDRVLDLLGTDIRYISPGLSPTSPRFPTDEENIFKDSFGQKWIQTYPYFSTDEGLLREIKSENEIDGLVNWPDANDPAWVEGVAARAAALTKSAEHFIVGRMVTSHGPFQLASDLRGMDNFLLDMAVDPDLSSALLERVTETICDLLRVFLIETNGALDMIELPGDDYANNDFLIFSPKMFRDYMKPCIERMVKTIRGIQPQIKIMLHSDGAITDLIPDVIDLGIDVLHPLEPVRGMDIPLIKEKYGKDISFIGGIDISKAMTGSLQDVRTDVDRCLRDLAWGGGYILGPANHLQADVPAENVLELFRYAAEAGRY